MKTLYIYIASALLIFCSCDKFLDVKPAKEVLSKDLLSTRKGCESALGGLYYKMGERYLYGNTLQFGVLDALVGYWDISSNNHQYYYLNNYDYSTALNTVNAFWGAIYKIIFNANNIINTLEARGDLDDFEKIILGEAIGIRAFLHLDLFRLYGPVVKKEGLSAKSIPYRKTADAVIQPFIPASEFLSLVIEDLEKAEVLLADDPILQNGGEGDGNKRGALDYNSLLDRRRNRFNINAAGALKARTYQLLGDQPKARECALKVLNVLESMDDIGFVVPEDFNTAHEANIRLTKEIIFGLYIRDHFEETKNIFGLEGAELNNLTSLFVNYEYINNFVYQNAGGDYRRNRWFQNSLNKTLFTRYASPAPSSGESFIIYRPEVSLISLSELYYILAESYKDSDPAMSFEHLNVVMKARGIHTLLDKNTANSDQVLKELVKEARRQYYGEGQLFYLLKRLYLDIEKSSTNRTPASLEIYKLPIPKAELEFNN